MEERRGDQPWRGQWAQYPQLDRSQEEQMAGDAIILRESNCTLMGSVFSVMYERYYPLRKRKDREAIMFLKVWFIYIYNRVRMQVGELCRT